MNWTNVLSKFKQEFKDYNALKENDEPTIPLINNWDGDQKIIKWVPIFVDALSHTYGSTGPLTYVLRDTVEVPDEADDPLAAGSYFGSSGSLHDKLIACLPHEGAIYKNDNKTVIFILKRQQGAHQLNPQSRLSIVARMKLSIILSSRNAITFCKM